MLSIVNADSMKQRWVLLVAGCAACSGDPAIVSLGVQQSALRVDGPAVTVALTFDDTLRPQLDAASILEDHGVFGTFYVNAPRLHEGSARPQSTYLSVEDALELQSRGHEVGGHTLSHPSLPSLSTAEAEREVMGDRRELLRLGLAVRSLAYPYGDVESAFDRLRNVVNEAGYANARDTNGFVLNRCDTGPEPLPPDEAYRLRSVRSVNNAPPNGAEPDTAETLLGWLDRASECGGGLLPLIFHELRADCSAPGAPAAYCFDFAELDRLAQALSAGSRCRQVGADEHCYDIQVAPVSEVLGHTDLEPAPEAFVTRNASLERTLASGSTECLQRTEGDGGTAEFERSTDVAHSGSASEHVAIQDYVAPAELRITRDFGACAPFAAEGAAYELSLFYRADPGGPAPTLRFVAYRLTEDHAWERWASSPAFTAASPGQWVQRSLATPPAPSGTIALGFGLRLESAGGVSVDDFGIAPAD